MPGVAGLLIVSLGPVAFLETFHETTDAVFSPVSQHASTTISFFGPLHGNEI